MSYDYYRVIAPFGSHKVGDVVPIPAGAAVSPAYFELDAATNADQLRAQIASLEDEIAAEKPKISDKEAPAIKTGPKSRSVKEND